MTDWRGPGISDICLICELPPFFWQQLPVLLWETTPADPSSSGRRAEWITVGSQHVSPAVCAWLGDGRGTQLHPRDSFWFGSALLGVVRRDLFQKMKKKKERLLSCVLNVMSLSPHSDFVVHDYPHYIDYWIELFMLLRVASLCRKQLFRISNICVQ